MAVVNTQNDAMMHYKHLFFRLRTDTRRSTAEWFSIRQMFKDSLGAGWWSTADLDLQKSVDGAMVALIGLVDQERGEDRRRVGGANGVRRENVEGRIQVGDRLAVSTMEVAGMEQVSRGREQHKAAATQYDDCSGALWCYPHNFTPTFSNTPKERLSRR
jgi:hypothetical protein